MFDIYMDSKIVGTAQLDRKGLYYQFTCFCKPPDSGLYRVCVSDGVTKADLGICVPEGERYTCTKRLPAKLLNGENLVFSLQPKDKMKNGGIVEIIAPFAHLEMLEQAKIIDENGQKVVVIEPVPIQQDSDLNQELLNK